MDVIGRSSRVHKLRTYNFRFWTKPILHPNHIRIHIRPPKEKSTVTHRKIPIMDTWTWTMHISRTVHPFDPFLLSMLSIGYQRIGYWSRVFRNTLPAAKPKRVSLQSTFQPFAGVCQFINFFSIAYAKQPIKPINSAA